jgi:hypothetical protein
MKLSAGLKSPVGLVTVTLTAAILLALSLLIATGRHGEYRDPATRILSPAAKQRRTRKACGMNTRHECAVTGRRHRDAAHVHLWKTRNAPAAIRKNPSA